MLKYLLLQINNPVRFANFLILWFEPTKQAENATHNVEDEIATAVNLLELRIVGAKLPEDLSTVASGVVNKARKLFRSCAQKDARKQTECLVAHLLLAKEFIAQLEKYARDVDLVIGVPVDADVETAAEGALNQTDKATKGKLTQAEIRKIISGDSE